jgi:hypothetical protein
MEIWEGFESLSACASFSLDLFLGRVCDAVAALVGKTVRAGRHRTLEWRPRCFSR